MMEIESQFQALKASWLVKLLKSKESWSFYMMILTFLN